MLLNNNDNIIKQSLRRKHPSRKHVVFREVLHKNKKVLKSKIKNTNVTNLKLLKLTSDYLKKLSTNRDPYSFFLKVVSRASIPKNMLALAKFWLPFQKWRIIGKKRRQNGYMLKNLLCFFINVV